MSLTVEDLPSFVKDFLIRKHIDSDGNLNREAIFDFLDKHIPDDNNVVKNRLYRQEQVQLLTRFIITTDIKGGKVRFAIPDAGIKSNEAVIPDYIVSQHREDLIDGEKWGVIKLIYIPPVGKEKGYIELADYKPFRPYKVDLQYFRDCRKQFTTDEWVDVLLSAMEYNPQSFNGTTQKLEFLTRLLIFVEPRLNMIELAPKGTGKSYVFGNLSKYGWLISGGKVSRAKLFYDKTRQQPGIMKNYDFVTFDEIQTIIFQDPPEMQAILKSYLEAGNATVDNYKFLSECSTMLMGNIELTSANLPRHSKYFIQLPESFRESALLDRFSRFYRRLVFARMNKKYDTQRLDLNVEYFSEVLAFFADKPAEYSNALNWKLFIIPKKKRLRDLKAVQKIASAYSKLLFPHIISVTELNKDEFKLYCLDPAIKRRGIIKEQCHKIDEEFKEYMPEIRIK